MENELTLAELAKRLPEAFSYEELCQLSDEQQLTYQNLLNNLITVNTTKSTTREKGEALEDLVAYLLNISGDVFSVYKNVRTATNEIDEIIKLNEKGRVLERLGTISARFLSFLGECKNYDKKVGVTYIGKFYSLLLTTGNSTGILFSFHGISGNGWKDGQGLVKKIYLQRENDINRTSIIDFSLKDFRAIAEGDNFFAIIDRKLDALRYDTSIESFISHHPAEKNF